MCRLMLFVNGPSKNEKYAKDVFETWSTTIENFEIGHAKLPPHAMTKLQELQKQITTRRLAMEKQAEDLRALGVNPEKNFHLKFNVVGRASRVGNEVDNQGLAEARADSTAAAIEQLVC